MAALRAAATVDLVTRGTTGTAMRSPHRKQLHTHQPRFGAWFASEKIGKRVRMCRWCPEIEVEGQAEAKPSGRRPPGNGRQRSSGASKQRR